MEIIDVCAFGAFESVPADLLCKEIIDVCAFGAFESFRRACLNSPIRCRTLSATKWERESYIRSVDLF